MFNADHADNFAHGAKSFVEIDGEIFGRNSVIDRLPDAIERFLSAPQAIAMAKIDRERVFGPQILFAESRENFGLKFLQTFSCRAGNLECVKVFPVVVRG